MIFGKSLAVLVVLGLVSSLAQAGNVRLFNLDQSEVHIGDIDACDMTVGDFKKVVAKETGIELARVRLSTTKGNPLLEDDALLSEYTTIFEDDLQLKICEDLQAPGEIHIDINHDRIELVVKKDKTLGWLKKEALGDADASLYRVFYQGRELTDESKTLAEYQFYKGAYVLMFKNDESFQIKVVPTVGRDRKFDVTLETSVDQLKKMIQESGIDTENQFLVHHGKVMPEHTKLFTHAMHPFHYGFVVHMVEKLGDSGDKFIMFQRKPEGIAHFSVVVKASNTVAELKEFAYKADPSIPVQEMQLRMADQIISGDDRKLSQFNLYPGAWIQVYKAKV